MSTSSLQSFESAHGELLRELFARAGAQRWDLSLAEFAAALRRSVEARVASDELDGEGIAAFVAGLAVEDLALAAACERGKQRAWLDFLERFRPVIVAAARSVAADDGKGDAIADEIYADLYGLEERDGSRRSLFRYFHGRSSLATWLRSVVTRSYVNEYRRARRTQTLLERAADEARALGAVAEPPLEPDHDAHVEHFHAALRSALAALAPRDRLRLACYHLRELTLAEVGRLLGEHESTVSRRLAATRDGLRKTIEERLRRDHGLSDDQIRVCCDTAVEIGSVDLEKELA